MKFSVKPVRRWVEVLACGVRDYDFWLQRRVARSLGFADVVTANFNQSFTDVMREPVTLSQREAFNAKMQLVGSKLQQEVRQAYKDVFGADNLVKDSEIMAARAR